VINKMNAKTAVIATMIGAASLTGAGFGIANAMTPAHPATSITHQIDTPTKGDTPDAPGAVDKPEAGDTPDAPGAVDKPEAGDTPDAPGAVDKPEAGDTPDAPGAVDKPEAGDTPDAPGQN